MLKSRWFALIAVLTLGLAGLARAQDADKPGDKPVNKREPALIGAIVSVGDTAIVVKPKVGGDNVTVSIDKSTKIKLDGENATVSDLKPGMNVTVPTLDKPARRVNARSGKKPAADAAKKDG